MKKINKRSFGWYCDNNSKLTIVLDLIINGEQCSIELNKKDTKYVYENLKYRFED